MSRQLHQTQRSKDSLSDDWETPFGIVSSLCVKYDFHIPVIDVCADGENTKAPFYILKKDNALTKDWNTFVSPYIATQNVWCNPPHSQNEEFVRKAFEQWQKHNLNIMMILPANTMSTKYWHEYIEGKAEYHPIKGRIRFLVNGKQSKFTSRNAYVCVIWRKK